MLSPTEERVLDRIKAICLLAASNFPCDTGVRISVSGTASGSAEVPNYMLLAMLEVYKKSALTTE